MRGSKITLFILSLICLFSIKTEAQGISCSTATNVTIKTNTYRDYSFPQNANAIWFSFVATSPKMDIEIATPINAIDTPFVHIDSLIIYSGSCGKLTKIGAAVKTSAGPTDTLPDVEISKLATGETYYIKAVRFLKKGDLTTPFFGLYEANLGARTVPTCSLNACGPNLVVNGDFENVPSWASAGKYQDSSDVASAIAPGAPINAYAMSSPNTRYWTSFAGVPLAGVSNYGDFTDIYTITQNIGSNSSFNNTAESGSYFMAVDCPSNHCLRCSSTSPNYWGAVFNTPNYTSIAWQQTIPVIPGATYVFGAWIENADVYNLSDGAYVSMEINGGTPFFQDDIEAPNYPGGWTQICYNWTAPAGVTSAKIQILGEGAPSEGGRDFSLDNISFALAQLPPVAVNSAVSCPGANTLLYTTPTISGASYAWSNGATTSSIVVTPTTTTTYSLTETVGTCKGTASGTVTINVPVVAVSATSTCAGQCNGTATASVTGGTAPYTYLWNNGQTSTSASGINLCAGTDSVKVTDAHGCSATKTVLILASLPPKIDVTSATVCKGSSTVLSIDSVTSGATYLWSNGATTNSITVSPTATTTYSVTQTAGGCTETATTIVTVDAPAVTLSETPTCSNSCVGTLTANATGGAAPYTYHWTGGATTQTATGLCAGLYTVYVTDANGCLVKMSTKMLPITPPKISVTSATICAGSSATITASGGSTSYLWSNGDSTASITVNPTTTTSYTVTGSGSLCSNTAVGTVTVYNRPTYTYLTHGACPAECNGTATFNVSGSTSPFTYSWATNGQTSTSASAINLCPGNDTAFITDSHGCKLDVPFSIQALATPPVTAVSTTICPGGTASICGGGATTYMWSTGQSGQCIHVSPVTTTTYNVTGTLNTCTASATDTVYVVPPPTVCLPDTVTVCPGTCASLKAASGECQQQSNLTYSWVPAAGITGNTHSASVSACPANTTTYTVTATNTVTGCSSSGTVVVSIYTPATINITSTASCSNSATGTATANVTSGTGPYTYSWNIGYTTSAIAQLNPNASYTITVTDGHGCKAKATTTTGIVYAPNIQAASVFMCPGTSAVLTATGGTSYVWSNGATGSSITVNPTTTTSYTVNGSNGTCSNGAFLTVTVYNRPTYTYQTLGSCAGECNGAAIFNVSGNTGPYSYSWAPGGATSLYPSYEHLCAGTDSLIITDHHGCKTDVSFPIKTIPSPTVTVTPDTACAGVLTGLCASGATTYQWLAGGTSACLVAHPTTTTTYTVIGKTGYCVDTAKGTITVLPTPTICIAQDTITLCPGTQATLNAASGACASSSQNLTYSWAPTTGLTGNLHSASVTASPTVNTTYTVTATNTAGCSVKGTITVMWHPRPNYTLNSHPSCAGTCNGIAVATVGGYDAPFTYSWAPGGQTTLNATTLCAGHDTLSIIDKYGCILKVGLNVQTAPSPTLTVTSDTVCSGSSTTICANGANTYSWNTGGHGQCITTTLTSPFAVSTATYQVTGAVGTCTATATSTVTVVPVPTICLPDTIKLCPEGGCASLNAACKLEPKGLTYSWAPATGLTGNLHSASVTACPTVKTTYTVTVTNALGCSKTATVVVMFYPRPNYTLNAHATCEGECNGVAVATVGGYDAPFTYSWAPGGQTTLNATTLCAGYDTLSIIDTYGCVLKESVLVRTIPTPKVTASSDTICTGGVAHICAAGATTYSWNTGANTTCINVSPLSTSTYQVTGNVGGCTATATSTVTVEPLPNICLPDTIKLCDNSCATLDAANKLCKVSPSGLTYTWAPLTGLTGNTSSYYVTACPTHTTTYTVTATNKFGCSKTATVTVVVYPHPNYTLNAHATCAGECNGVAVATVNGLDAPFTYSWAPGGQTTLNATTLCAGYDTLSIIDKYGCVLKESVLVKIAPSPTLTVTSDTICRGGVAHICANGATTYSWSTLAHTACINVSPLNTTTYQVTGTVGACSATATGTVTVEPIPVVCLPDTIEICPGSCTTLDAAGKLCKASPKGLTYTWAPLTGLTGNTSSFEVTACPTHTTTYTVTATNAAGCSKTATVTVVVYNSTFTYSINAHASCAGTCNGIAVVNINGSGAPFTYLWAPGGQTIANATTLCPGWDTLTVTDKHGCKLVLPWDVKTAPSPTLTVTSDTICQFGTAHICANGANSYLWNTGQNLQCINVSAAATTVYHVTGTVGTCTAIATSTVTVLPAPTICLPDTVTMCELTHTTLNAAGGACHADTTGVIYNWAPSTGLTGNLHSASVSASPIHTTTYTVTATNALGCSKTGTVTVVVHDLPPYYITSYPTCAGACNGSGFLQVFNLENDAPYTFSWSPGGQTDEFPNTLCAGPDTVTVTDKYGCKLVLSTYVHTTATPTLAVTSDTICAGNSATICANGGTSYMWSIGSTAQCLTVSPATTTTYPVTGTVGNCTATGTSTVTVLPAPTICLPDTVNICPGSCASLNAANGPCKAQSVGVHYSWAPAAGLAGNLNSYYVTACPKQTTTYTVTATNAAGCSKTDSVTVIPYTPPIYDYSVQGTCAGSCNGSAFIGLSPATYTFSWSPGGQTVNHPTNLCAGNDTVTITDTHGCKIVQPIVIQTIAAPTITATSDTICAGGSATICANGGTNYMWAIGSTAQCLTVSPATTTSYTVTSNSGKCGTDTAVSTVYVVPTPSICLPDTIGICPGTCASLNAANGPCKAQSVGLTYSWAPAAGLTGNLNSYYVTACPKQTTTYTVTATNTVTGCSKTATVTVMPYLQQIYDYSYQGACAGTCNGSAFIGLSPVSYTFSWSPGGQTGNHPTNLCAGNDTVTITDMHGCLTKRAITIGSITTTALTATSDTICAGGSATICANGGTNYMWAIGSTSQCLTVSPAVTTSYTVTNNTGKCGVDTAVATVYIAPAPTICLPDTVGVCPGFCASLNAACNGQSAGLTYSWSPTTGITGNTNSAAVSACPSKTTTYKVTVTNVAGCSKVDSVTVVVYTHLVQDYAVHGTCAGSCNGGVNTFLSPSIYTFAWSSGQTVANPTNLCGGPDTMIAIDTHGCKRELAVYIPTIPSPTITATSTSICAGTSATICGGGGTNYTWSNNSTSQCITVSPTVTTSYTVTTASGNCGIDQAVATVTVTNCPSIEPETKPISNVIENVATIYPNPASTQLHVSVSLGLNETDNICIYNSVGEAVKCETLKESLSTISTSELAAGIYFYRITDSNGALIKADKLMIVR